MTNHEVAFMLIGPIIVAFGIVLLQFAKNLNLTYLGSGFVALGGIIMVTNALVFANVE